MRVRFFHLAAAGAALSLTLFVSASGQTRSWPVSPGAGGAPGFTLLTARETGVLFTNLLQGDEFLTNAVAHNGSGVALGDVDANGWTDIYFCSLQGPNRLFLNEGNWNFREAALGTAACAEQFSTGAAFADLDGDGDLDLLVNGIAAGTRLFANDGKGAFTEASDTGLSRSNSATSIALADIDGDGDLDLYCAHYLDVMHLADSTTKFALARRGNDFEVTAVNGVPATTPRLRDRFQILPGGRLRELPERDALYLNDGRGRFKAVQNEPGTFLNEEGQPIPPFRDWGLAVMFRDINGDLAPDLYVCNDNATPSRFWLNTGRGVFRLQPPTVLRHTSRSAMGLDFADIDRDGHDDFIVVDMLAREPAGRLTQLVKDYPAPEERFLADAVPRYNRNTLFLGRSDRTYREAAFMAGLAASDWSWCPIFLDADLDGFEDLLVSTGFAFDVMDRDSHDELRKAKLTEHARKRARQFHPPWPSVIAAFRNLGDGQFAPADREWGFTHVGIAHGMAAGDLDKDGDLDLAINNLNAPASIYRNNAAAPRIGVRLAGNTPNTRGVGARITVTSGGLRQSQEMIAGGRYMSGDDHLRVFAAPGAEHQIEVTWRDGSQSIVSNALPNRVYEVSQAGASRRAEVMKTAELPFFEDVSGMLNHSHAETPGPEANAQPLALRVFGRNGPALVWFDFDGDGWEDLAATGGNGTVSRFRNIGGRSFHAEPALKTGGEPGAILGWHDGKGGRYLLAAVSAGATNLVRGYSFSGSNVFTLPFGAEIGALATADADLDGDLELFVGGRMRPGRYPEAADSEVWLNDQGVLVKSDRWSAPLSRVGMVNSAVFADLDSDGRADLALALDCGPVKVFRNEPNGLREITAEWGFAPHTGWWTSLAAGDFDGDGRIDFAAGNWGRNSEYEMHRPGPTRIYYGDWNADGTLDLLEAWRDGEVWRPVRNRSFMMRGVPELARPFATHKAYAEASVENILGPRVSASNFLEVSQLESSIFLNRGGRFERVALPTDAQLTPAMSVAAGDFNSDGHEDIYLAQNFFGAVSDLSREDSGFGLWLRGNGRGEFTPVNPELSGIRLAGEQRAASLADFNRDGRIDIVAGQNNGAAKLYRNQMPSRGLRVSLAGPPGNPEGVGAQFRVRGRNGVAGPLRVITAGSGWLSQHSAGQILGLPEGVSELWVRWPDGSEETAPISGPGEIRLAHPATTSPSRSEK